MNLRTIYRVVLISLTLCVLFGFTPESIAQSEDLQNAVLKVQTLYEQGNLAEAELAAGEALRLTEKEFGAKSLEYARSANDYAGVLTDQQKYDLAEQVYRQALQIRQDKLGPHHPDVATSLNNLAYLLSARGSYSEAEKSFKRALEIWSKQLPDHANHGTVLNNLGELYFRQERYTEAEPFFRKAMAIRAKALGPKHPQLGISLNNLAFLFSATGRYREALPLYGRALAIVKSAKGPDHQDVGTAYQNLGEAQQELNKLDQAQESFEAAVRVRKLYPTAPSLLAVSLNSLAEVYSLQGKFREAVPLYLDVVKIEESRATQEPGLFLFAVRSYAKALLDAKEYSQAELEYRRALQLTDVQGGEREEFVISLEQLADMLVERGRSSEAEPLYRRALQTLQSINENPTLHSASLMMRLARALRVRGDFEEAKRLLDTCLQIRLNLLGQDHPEIAQTYGEFGLLAQAQKQFSEAEQYFLKDIALAEKVFRGKAHPDIALAKFNLAELYRTEGRNKEAEQLLRDSLKIAEKSLGRNHEFTKGVKQTLDGVP